jgi:hypothetical protein
MVRHMDDILSEVAVFLSAQGMKDSRFGREAVGDPTFVGTLRAGREPRRATVEKVRRYMLTYSGTA